LFQQDLDVSITQRPELVDENNPGEESWIPGDTFLDSGHADEHHAKSASIKNGAQLLQTVHCETVGFIDDDQGSGVRDSLRAWPRTRGVCRSLSALGAEDG
jgi:hypothetical protein